MIAISEKFNMRKEVDKLKEIYDAKKPSKEQFKKAVIDALPKADNPDVKDFNAFLGVEKDILPGQLRKEKQIEKYVDKKQESIKQSAILRDAAMFAVAEWDIAKLYLLNAQGRTEYYKDARILMEQLHEKWIAYFTKIYNGDENE